MQSSLPSGVMRNARFLVSAKSPTLANARSNRYTPSSDAFADRAIWAAVLVPFFRRSAMPSSALTAIAWLTHFPAVRFMNVIAGDIFLDPGCLCFRHGPLQQYWQRQPHAATRRKHQGGDVRALDSQTLSTTATCFQYHEYGRRTGLKIRSSQEGVGSSLTFGFNNSG